MTKFWICLLLFFAMVLVDAGFGEKVKEKVVVAPVYTVDLDLPPEQRWNQIVSQFKDIAPSVAEYFTSQVPKVVADLIEQIAAGLDGYLGDYGKEMKGISQAMGLDLGVIVALNFAYELRRLGGGVPNITGSYEPKACTSIVAQDPQNNIFHGRNMDWNLPDSMRKLTFQGEFKKNGKTLFIGSCFAGYIGVLTGMRPNIYGVSIDERDLGGSIITDSLEAVLRGSWSPSHLLREVLTTADTYEEAVSLLSTKKLSAPTYYIASGTNSNEGIVLTRDRNSLVDGWKLNAPQQWYLLETNFDHWKPAPKQDDRRDYGIKYMNAMGRSNLNVDNLYSVLSKWPINNDGTTYTALMHKNKSSMVTFVRLVNETTLDSYY